MAKAAIYAEDAKRKFVEEGLSLDAIVGILVGKVSRKTLYNWKVQGDWETKRKEYLAQTKGLGNQLRRIVDVTAENAEAKPTSKTIRAMLQALVAYEKYMGMNLGPTESTEKEKDIAKTLPPETLIYIKKALYGLS